MPIQRRRLSRPQIQHPAEQRESVRPGIGTNLGPLLDDAIDPAALLWPRRVSARALGVSIPTILRLEAKGIIAVVKLSGPNSMALHRAEQIRALVNGANNAD